ncbi:tumor necrosis factor receptor superfamily member 1A-like [Pelodytes ibericus]
MARYLAWIGLLLTTATTVAGGVLDLQCDPAREYPNNSLCCVNCPAGTYVRNHCTINHGRSQCEPCSSGDFTAYPNGIEHCLTCRMCRDDEELVKPCTRTSDAQCRCKPGTFCLPQNTCGFMCRACSSCDGRVKHVCNVTADTVCHSDNRDVSPTDTASADGHNMVSIILGVFGLTAVIILVGIFLFLKSKAKKRRLKETGLIESCSSVQSGGSESCTAHVSQPTPTVAGRCDTAPSAPPLQDHGGSDTGFASTPAEREKLLQKSDGSGAPETLVPTPQREPSPSKSLEQEPQTLASSHRGSDAGTFPVQLEVTEAEWRACFYCFIDEVPNKDWKKFMRTVLLKDKDIESSINNHPSDVSEQKYSMLRYWRQQLGVKASLQMLLDALSKMDLEGCKENVQNQLQLQAKSIS